MSYKHNGACSSCRQIRAEVDGDHHGRKVSRLFREIDNYHWGKQTLVAICDMYKGEPSIKSLENHSRHHQLFTSEDIAASRIKELQRKSADEKIQAIFKASINSQDIRAMVKGMFLEILEDETKREKFLGKLKPADMIKMATDEDTLELKRVDTVNDVLKTMNAFASGATAIDIPYEEGDVA